MTNTIIDLVDRFERDPNTAIIHNGNKTDYADFYNDITGLSDELLEQYGSQSNQIIVISENKYKFLVGIYAVMYSGNVAVPVDNDLPQETIEHMITVTDADLILTDDSVTKLETETKKAEIQLGLFTESPEQPTRINKETNALILFTSGTTGKKKGVLLSHHNLLKTSKYINDFMGVDRSITEHILVPIYHSFGFARTRCVFLKKGTIVLDDGQFNPLLAFNRMTEFDCNAFSGVPSIMAMLIEAGDGRFSQISDQVQYVEIGSSPMKKKHKEYLISSLPRANICMHYGLTEASRTCFIDFRVEQNKLDSVGRPSPGVTVRILDDNRNEVDTGEIGEIAVKGPNVAKGYISTSGNDIDEIDGWFYTGDTGYKDEDGYIYFKGREDDIINVGGEKVAPLEIEELIRESNPRPDEFCVVASDDTDGIYGSVPAMYTTEQEFTDNDLQKLNEQLLSKGLKKIFRPRSVIHLDQIPRTDNGKILRNEIRDR